MSAHTTTDDLRVPEVNGSWKCHGGDGAESRRGAHDRPHVAGVLNTVQHEDHALPTLGEVGERPRGDLTDGYHPLWGFRFGCRSEILRGHFFHNYSTLTQRLREQRASRRVEQLWRRERTANLERGANELLD